MTSKPRPVSVVATDCNQVPEPPCLLYAQKNDTVTFTMTVPEGTDVSSLDFMLIEFPGDSEVSIELIVFKCSVSININCC